MEVLSSAFVSKGGKPRPVLNRMLAMRNRLRKPLGLSDRAQAIQSDEENA
jgi:hypothetical protein